MNNLIYGFLLGVLAGLGIHSITEDKKELLCKPVTEQVAVCTPDSK